MTHFEENFEKIQGVIANSKVMIASIQRCNYPDESRIKDVKSTVVRTCENFLNFYKFPVSEDNVKAVLSGRKEDIKQLEF